MDTPIMEEVFPPGQPTVEMAGPLLPALATKTTLFFSTSRTNCSNTALDKEQGERERGRERERERERERLKQVTL